MREKPWIETERLIVRLAEPKDALAIATYYQKNRAFHKPFDPIRSEEFFTQRYWSVQAGRNLQDFYRDSSVRLFMAEHSAPEEIIGNITFSSIIRGVFQACLLGYSLGEAQQGQGYMTEGLKGAIAYMFDAFNLHRVMANYMPRNERSGNVLKRLGFKVEGYAEDYLMINGQWEDHILTSLTNRDWQPEKR